MKTGKGWKLFEQDKNGNLYPLFIDNKSIIPTGEWIEAKNKPTKNFAKRPGWHLGKEIPDAPGFEVMMVVI